MGIIDTIKSGLQGHFDKNREQKELEERLRFEANVHKMQIFEEEFRKNSLEVARAQAKKEAAEKSGLQKLRAVNRSAILQRGNVAPGSFFEKMRDLTQKNKANREENLKRTEAMRGTAKKMREDRLAEQNRLRESRLARVNKRRSQGGLY